MISAKNMQAAPINQKRGPVVGNAGTTSKRDTFTKEKASSNNEKSALANMVMSALEGRGQGMKSHRDPSTEPLKANVGKAANPTADGAKLPAKYKAPKK